MGWNEETGKRSPRHQTCAVQAFPLHRTDDCPRESELQDLPSQ